MKPLVVRVVSFCTAKFEFRQIINPKYKEVYEWLVKNLLRWQVVIHGSRLPWPRYMFHFFRRWLASL